MNGSRADHKRSLIRERAHSFDVPDLSAGRQEVHEIGDGAFEQTFVTAPSLIIQGLARYSITFPAHRGHINDGRGKAPGLNEPLTSMLIRISIPGSDAHGGPNPCSWFWRAIATTQCIWNSSGSFREN